MLANLPEWIQISAVFEPRSSYCATYLLWTVEASALLACGWGWCSGCAQWLTARFPEYPGYTKWSYGGEWKENGLPPLLCVVVSPFLFRLFVQDDRDESSLPRILSGLKPWLRHGVPALMWPLQARFLWLPRLTQFPCWLALHLTIFGTSLCIPIGSLGFFYKALLQTLPFGETWRRLAQKLHAPVSLILRCRGSLCLPHRT